jgi:predicted ATPase/DNA-binding NarL/FixJ family response regulator
VLDGKQLLLVLDNCEHLLKACVQLVATLLTETDISILTTSREPLRVTGERLYPMPPLSLPPQPFTPDTVASMSRFDAIQLFVERAQAILPTFALTDDNAGIVVNICHQLDGLPLAIEMAAARVNVLTVKQITTRLDDHFALLAPAEHFTFGPHQTLQAAIDWSYDLLTEPEQLLLQRLSVFVGGCSLNEAETVCAGDSIEPQDVLDLLASLVQKSLVTAATLQRIEARYTLLETIRQYGQEKLKKAGEWHVIRDRHLNCFSDLAQETDLKIRGEYQQLWLNWLEGENDNMRAALAWSLESAQIETGLRTAIALFQFWTIRDYVQEGLTWFQRLVSRSRYEVDPLVRSNALARAATLAGRRGRIELERAYADEAANLAEAAGEEGKRALAWALGAQAWVAHKTGDFAAALALGLQGIHLFRELDEDYLLGVSLSLFSFLAMSLGKYEQAQAMLDEALPLLRELGDQYRLAMSLNYYGDLARCQGNFAEAIPAYEESLSLLGEIDAVRDQASVYHNLGHTFLHLGDVEQARTLFQKSLATHKEQGNDLGETECLIGFAALAVIGDRPADGVRLLSAAASLGGRTVTSEWAATRMEYEYYLDRARAGLSETVFRSEQAAGQRLSLAQAEALAEEAVRKMAVARQTHQQLDQLTPREREVASLIAQAKSNDDIAAELVVSKRTVESHIGHIRSKLGFSERTQIVRWAIEAGLVQTSK